MLMLLLVPLVPLAGFCANVRAGVGANVGGGAVVTWLLTPDP